MGSNSSRYTFNPARFNGTAENHGNTTCVFQKDKSTENRATNQPSETDDLLAGANDLNQGSRAP
jgi:hypothetical protein